MSKFFFTFTEGHTHIANIQDSPEGILMVNPGSLLQPRSSSKIRGFLKEQKPRPSVAFLNIEDNIVSAFLKKL